MVIPFATEYRARDCDAVPLTSPAASPARTASYMFCSRCSRGGMCRSLACRGRMLAASGAMQGRLTRPDVGHPVATRLCAPAMPPAPRAPQARARARRRGVRGPRPRRQAARHLRRRPLRPPAVHVRRRAAALRGVRLRRLRHCGAAEGPGPAARARAPGSRPPPLSLPAVDRKPERTALWWIHRQASWQRPRTSMARGCAALIR